MLDLVGKSQPRSESSATLIGNVAPYTSPKAKTALVLIVVSFVGLVFVGGGPRSSAGAAAVVDRLVLLDALLVVGIVLGHVGLSQIRKSVGQIKGRFLAITGLILGYLCLLVFGLINAFAIHDILTLRIAENEYSAVSSIQHIVEAEGVAATIYPDTPGAHCDLAELGQLGLIDEATARGEKQGYRFKVTCAEPTNGVITEPLFKILATPTKPGDTGVRAYCYSYGQIRYVEDVRYVPDANISCNASNPELRNKQF
jgi:hypothetical protein